MNYINSILMSINIGVEMGSSQYIPERNFRNKQTILILDDKQFIYASQVVELHDILGTYVNPY